MDITIKALILFYLPTRLVIQGFFFPVYKRFQNEKPDWPSNSTFLAIGVNHGHHFVSCFPSTKLLKSLEIWPEFGNICLCRKKLIQPSFMYSLHAKLLMDRGLIEVQNMSTFPSNTNVQGDKSNTVFPYQVWWLYGFTCKGSLHLSKLELELNYLSSCLKLLPSPLWLLSQVLTNIKIMFIINSKALLREIELGVYYY